MWVSPPRQDNKSTWKFSHTKKRTVHMATVTLCGFCFYISKVSLEHLSVLWTSLSLRVPLNLSSACRGWQLPPALIGTCLKRHLVWLSFPCHTKTPTFSSFLYAGGLCVCVRGVDSLLHQHSISQPVLWQVLVRFLSHHLACFRQRFSLTPATQTDSRCTTFCYSSEWIPTATMRGW